MIVFDLLCHDGQHSFEGWFGSSDDFERQRARGLVACPQCGSAAVTKAPMAPMVGRKGNQAPAVATPAPPPASAPASAPPPMPVSNGPLPEAAAQMIRALAEMQAEALKQSRWVGDSFADQSRAMHYGEAAAEPIHGQATPDEARALLEEGIEVAPLPFPVVPPGKAN